MGSKGRFFLDGCAFTLGIHLVVFGIATQVQVAGASGQLLLLGMGISLGGGLLVLYGIYRACFFALKKLQAKGAGGQHAPTIGEES